MKIELVSPRRRDVSVVDKSQVRSMRFAASSTVQDHVSRASVFRDAILRPPYTNRDHTIDRIAERGWTAALRNSSTNATLHPRNRTNNPSPKAQVSTKSQTRPLHTKHEQGSKPVSLADHRPTSLTTARRSLTLPAGPKSQPPAAAREPRSRNRTTTQRGRNFHPKSSLLELLHRSRSGRLSRREMSSGVAGWFDEWTYE